MIDHVFGVSSRSTGIPALVRLVIVAFLLSNAASFMVMPMLAVSLAARPSFSGLEVGAVLSLYFASSRIAPLVLGPLSDVYGHAKFLRIGLVTRAIGYGLMAVADYPGIAILAALAMGMGGAAFESAAYGLVQQQPARIREIAIVQVNMALNIGVVIGPLLGVVVSGHGNLPFVVSSAAFVLIFLVFCAVRFSAQNSEPSVPHHGASIRLFVASMHDRRFRLLLICMLPWFFLFSQLFVLLPVVAASSGGSDQWTNAVFIVNGVVGIVLLAAMQKWMPKASPYLLMTGCYFIAAAAFAMLIHVPSMIWLLAAVALFSIAEVLILPVAEIQVSRLAPADRGGAYFGAFNAAFGLGGSLGHLVGGWLALGTHSSWAPWVMSMMAICGALGSLAIFLPMRRNLINQSAEGN